MAVTPRSAFVWMLALVATATVVVEGGVKIRTAYDKNFDFAAARTYAWHPTGAGTVMLLVMGVGNAEDIRRRVEPTVVQAVEEGMKQRGFTKTSPDRAALHVNYYALVGQGTSAQQMGQFVPAVPEWGLPPLPPSTTSLVGYPSGSLVLDISSSTLQSIVWRAVGEAEIDPLRADAQRQKRLTAAIKDMLKKFPPKK